MTNNLLHKPNTLATFGNCVAKSMEFLDYNTIQLFSQTNDKVIHSMIINKTISFAFAYGTFHSMSEIANSDATWFIPEKKYSPEKITNTPVTYYVDPYTITNIDHPFFQLHFTSNVNVVFNDVNPNDKNIIYTYTFKNKKMCIVHTTFTKYKVNKYDSDYNNGDKKRNLKTTQIIDCLELFPNGAIPDRYFINNRLRKKNVAFINTDHIVSIGDGFLCYNIANEMYLEYTNRLFDFHMPTFKNLKTIGNNFLDCAEIKNFTMDVQPSLVSIGKIALSNARCLTNVIIDNMPSLTTVGLKWLFNCWCLQNVNISNMPVLQTVDDGWLYMFSETQIDYITIKNLPMLQSEFKICDVLKIYPPQYLEISNVLSVNDTVNNFECITHFNIE